MTSQEFVRPGSGKLGMRLLLASLGMLFAATLMGFIVIRTRAAVWPPEGAPPLPIGLWLSTILILAGSGTVQWALGSVRRDGRTGFRTALYLTLALDLAFLVNQTISWFGPMIAGLTLKPTLYAFTYYLLTGLHALHVLGGLIPLMIVAVHFEKGRYSATDTAGVEYLTMYWHFLTVMWVIIYATLLICS